VKTLIRCLACAGIGLMVVCPQVVEAQQRPEGFQRREQPTDRPVTVFHSTQSANLPTAETLGKGELLFEISHRFLPPISDGADALWGFDGPAYNRFGLAVAVSDQLMLGVVRSNLHDNLELNGKLQLWGRRSGTTSVLLGAMGGVAWNTEAPFGADDNEMQAYVQVMLNVMVGEKLALGLVPTLLHNPVIADASTESILAIGAHGQLYMSQHASLFVEWTKSARRPGLEFDSGTFGIELETGGHFFKILLTNQPRMNATQFLAGTPFDFTADEWRVGFNLTRVLAF
jgi:uncharacterized beta barrel domain-containing protein DUF5777